MATCGNRASEGLEDGFGGDGEMEMKQSLLFGQAGFHFAAESGMPRFGPALPLDTANSHSFLRQFSLHKIADTQKQMTFIRTDPRGCPLSSFTPSPVCSGCLAGCPVPKFPIKMHRFPTLCVSQTTQTAPCPTAVTVWVLAGTAAARSRQWRPSAAGEVTLRLSGSCRCSELFHGIYNVESFMCWLFTAVDHSVFFLFCSARVL